MCVFVHFMTCVCVFLWLAPASLPPFPIRPHGSLPLVCLQRLHLSKKKRKRANIDQIMCRCCVCVLCLGACMRVCEFLYICERVPRWHSSLAFIQRITLQTLCEAATIDIPKKVGVWGKKHCFDHVTHLISTLLYASLCWIELRLDDQDKEPMIDKKIIYMDN